MNQITQRLKGEGRVFVRYSGTEPVLRILVEGPDKKQIASDAEAIADLIQRQAGS